MDNLSLNEASSPQRQQPLQPQDGPPPPQPVFDGPPPQGPPQLPPQMFTTAAQLLDLTDKKLMLVLRDGRKLLGVLRTWDQFANLVLTDTKERYYVTIPSSSPSSSSNAATTPQPTNGQSSSTTNTPDTTRRLYCDIPRGTYLVRGENVLLIGEVDLDKDDDPPPGFEEGKVEEVFALQKQYEAEKKRKDKIKGKKAAQFWGGELEGSGEVLF